MRLNGRSGFSLVELMTALAIIGVLAAIAVPTFLNWLPNMRLKAAARDIYSNIQQARLEASKQNVCAGVDFSTVTFPVTGGSYTQFIDDGSGTGTACDGIQNGNEASLLTSNIVGQDSSLISVSNSGTPCTVCFSPTSVTCASQSCNIQIRNNKSRWYQIAVTASGGVRIEMSGDGINWSN